MPPPSSPADRQHQTWNIRRYSQASETTSESDNVEDSGGEREGTRLNTLNMLSNFFLRSRNSNDTDWRGWHNRYSSVNDAYLHINDIPIQIRNINFEEGEHNYMSGTDLSDHDSNDETYHEEFDDGTESASDANDGISHIQLNERLLLSSARQNLTNTNTLISFDDEHNNEDNDNHHGGVPLRRSNAVRLRGRSLSSEKDIKNKQKMLKKEAKSIYRDIHMILENINNLKHYKGESPVFSDHTLVHKYFVNQENEHKESLFLNLDTVMDSFLEKSRAGKLWSNEKELNYSSSTSNNKKAKRKIVQTEEESDRKRHKTERPDSSPFFAPSQAFSTTKGDKILVSFLSIEQKRRIMNIMRSSYLKAGTTFSMQFSDFNSFDLNFSSVDYESKTLNGVFCVEPYVFGKESSQHFISRLKHLKEFLIGTDLEKKTLPKENNIVKKFRLVSRLEGEIYSELSRNEVSLSKAAPFLVPFGGRMVDFKNDDLRFLNSIEMPLNMRVRSLQIARTKSFRVRSQLSEWMKINPFRQFQETYFLKKLAFIDKRLKSFAKAKSVSSLEEDSVELGRGLRANIYELTRDFELFQNNDSPVPFFESDESVKEFPLKDVRPNLFIQNWQRSVCDKLTEFVTCKGHCLLNVQLNYILFKLEVDLEEFLDNYFHYLLQLCPIRSANKYKSAFKSFSQSGMKTESQMNVLIGSLNRKTGCIELQNTTAYLDFKNMYQSGSSNYNRTQNELNSFATLNEQSNLVDLDSLLSSEESDEENILQGHGHETRRENVHKDEITTTAKGKLKRSYSLHSMGGGNPSYIHV